MRLVFISVLVIGAATANFFPAYGAVRECSAKVSSGRKQATTVGQAQRLAIAAWAAKAGIAAAERHTQWRQAQARSLNCGPAPVSGVTCEAIAGPCHEVPSAGPPGPKRIPVAPSNALKGGLD